MISKITQSWNNGSWFNAEKEKQLSSLSVIKIQLFSNYSRIWAWPTEFPEFIGTHLIDKFLGFTMMVFVLNCLLLEVDPTSIVFLYWLNNYLLFIE